MVLTKDVNGSSNTYLGTYSSDQKSSCQANADKQSDVRLPQETDQKGQREREREREREKDIKMQKKYLAETFNQKS